MPDSSGRQPRERRVGRREFLKGACLGAIGALLPLDGLTREAFADGAPASAPPAAPALPRLPTMEEVVAEWKPDALFARPGKQVLHFFPPEGRGKLPKDLKEVEKPGADARVNRGQYRAILRQLVAKNPEDAKLARAAAILDPLDPEAVARALGLLGKRKQYADMIPFLDDMDRAIEELAKRDRGVAKKLGRLKDRVAGHREKVLGRARRKRENSPEGR